MRIERLKKDRQKGFIDYCIRYRDRLDDSFLTDDVLKKFELNEENPTHIILDDADKIVGVSSLYKSKYYKRSGKARFRILHSEIYDVKVYKKLLEAALLHVDELERLIIFCPEQNEELTSLLPVLGFEIERYAFILDREDLPIPEWKFPEDYELRTFRYGKDEEDWCKARNAAFAKHLGSEAPITPTMLSKFLQGEDNIEDGMMILYHKSEPVGVLCVAKEFKNNEDYASIVLLGLIPEYQKKGLGRKLLQAGLSFGRDNGMNKATLAVNAENKSAADLYLSEGFHKDGVYIGYNYNLK
ncbi:MAG: GNAT family N-acetyltransferase [Bacillota bacterium]